jgi:hypothetical protein
MRRAPYFAVYCLLVLGFYTIARFEGWILFASSGRIAAQAAASGGRAAGGATGYHK